MYLDNRSDLSPFITHLTRDTPYGTAKQKLTSILENHKILVGRPFGMAVDQIRKTGTEQIKQKNLDSQRCVCFTEIPLENIKNILGLSNNEQWQFKNYGIAVTRNSARKQGANPVWYLDMTRKNESLTTPVEKLIEESLRNPDDFCSSHIAAITPFIEPMFIHSEGSKKEVWWEREWRSTSPLFLLTKICVLCPEAEIENFKKVCAGSRIESVCFIDPLWPKNRIDNEIFNLFDYEDLFKI
jgi:hypothetical protein